MAQGAGDYGHMWAEGATLSRGFVYDDQCFRSLMQAVRDNNPGEVSRLVTAEIVNKRDEHDMTPLMLAAQLGHLDIVSGLLTIPGVDTVCASTSKGSPLALAIHGQHLELVRFLVSRLENNLVERGEANVHIDDHLSGADRILDSVVAIKTGNLELVKFVLTKAAEQRRVDVKNYLLGGMPPDSWHSAQVPQTLGDHLLELAISMNYLEIVRYLVGAEVGVKISGDALFNGVGMSVEIAQCLVEAGGISLDDTDLTPFAMAAGSAEVQEYLLKKAAAQVGVDIKTYLSRMNQVWRDLPRSGHSEGVQAIKEVVDRGASYTDLLLYSAVRSNNLEGVRFLVERVGIKIEVPLLFLSHVDPWHLELLQFLLTKADEGKDLGEGGLSSILHCAEINPPWVAIKPHWVPDDRLWSKINLVWVEAHPSLRTYLLCEAICKLAYETNVGVGIGYQNVIEYLLGDGEQVQERVQSSLRLAVASNCSNVMLGCFAYFLARKGVAYDEAAVFAPAALWRRGHALEARLRAGGGSGRSGALPSAAAPR